MTSRHRGKAAWKDIVTDPETAKWIRRKPPKVEIRIYQDYWGYNSLEVYQWGIVVNKGVMAVSSIGYTRRSSSVRGARRFLRSVAFVGCSNSVPVLNG
jgi:hypothetical protein